MGGKKGQRKTCIFAVVKGTKTTGEKIWHDELKKHLSIAKTGGGRRCALPLLRNLDKVPIGRVKKSEGMLIE